MRSLITRRREKLWHCLLTLDYIVCWLAIENDFPIVAVALNCCYVKNSVKLVILAIRSTLEHGLASEINKFFIQKIKLIWQIKQGPNIYTLYLRIYT